MEQFAVITHIQLSLGLKPDGIAGPKTWKAIYEQIVGTSAMPENIATVIAMVQTSLHLIADGDPGEKTWEAISHRMDDHEELTDEDISPEKVDARSETEIAELLPEVQPLARQLVHQAAAAGVVIKIISAYRSYDEQNALYAQGRSKPGPIVTNANGGYSNHNFAIAFDIGVFENGKYMGNSPSYAKVGPIGRALGLAWGGDWKSIKDTPHYELRPTWAAGMNETKMLAGLRDRKARGVSLLV